MCDFVFCLGSHNKKLLSDRLISNKKGWYLYLGKKYHIGIKIVTLSNRKYIVVDFDKNIEFMKFLVRKNIHCNMFDRSHKCKSHVYYKNYLRHIIDNKCLDHIKILYSKFFPLIRSQGPINNIIDISKPLILFKNYTVGMDLGIDQETIMCIFKYGKMIDVASLFIHVLRTISDVTFEFLDDMLSIYKRKIIKLFTKEKHELDNDLNIIPIEVFLMLSFRNDDVDMFYFVIEEMSKLHNHIDTGNFTRQELCAFNKFVYNFNANNINTIINTHLIGLNHEYYFLVFYCPKIFNQLILELNDISLLSESIMFDILQLDFVEYMIAICETIGNSNPKILVKFLRCAKSIEMAQLLIDYGADYEKLYKSSKFSKCNSHVKLFIEKLVRETIDS
ncbi:hypothetical protein [Niemeyer virus]|uniref:Uncharacterized protein n=1 Tax=Acanthamoeba polyphaga mimivirus Kroon TaxID=3069720 RepID=A0A0G2Y5Q6_9VIRU|nr:hypothetical protein QJ850_gp785 [Acanthamoeba polyphaga mimivirus]AKI79914.1 hypothetical protein [Acanthamoeba polyphaga mimivirus Kroon]ALR83746.1 hypothetical protein [Niemeyer virus]